MQQKVYLHPSATDAEVIRVDDACYHRSCVMEQEPDVQAQDIEVEYAICQECACGGVGQYRFMTYQMVAQNVAGWGYVCAHPLLPEAPIASLHEEIDLCCSIIRADYHSRTHQRVAANTLAWDAIRAHPEGDQGQRSQYAVHQVIQENPNRSGYDFVRAHSP